MKNHRQFSGSQFGPRPHMLRRKAKFIGELMKKSQKDFQRSRTYMQPNMEDRNCNGNRRDNGVAYKSNCNAKDQRDKVVPQPARQIPSKYRNIRLSDSPIVIENFVPMENSASKSNHAFAPPSKDLKQPTTSRFENCSICLPKNIKQVNTPRPNNEFSSKNLEKYAPLRLKDDSNDTLGCSKKSHPVKAKERLICNSNNIERSNSQPNHLNAMPRLVHKAKNVDELNQCNNVLGLRSKGRSNPDQGENIVVREGNIERFKYLNGKGVLTTSKRSNVSMSKEFLVDLKAMSGLVHKARNVDEWNQCNNVLGSRSKGRSNPDQGENIVVREGNIGRFKSFNGKGVLTTSKRSNLSMSKELLVPNKEPLNDKKRQDEVISDKDKETGHTSLASIERIMCGEVHFACDDHHKQEDFLKAKEAPNSNSALKGNQVMQDLRSNSGNNSFPIFGKVLSSQQRVVASCMDDNTEWNGDPSDGCIQLDGRNRKTKFAEGGRTGDVELKRKRIEPLPEEQPMTDVDDDSEEAENSRPMNKRRRYREINEDEEAVDMNPIGVEDDTAGSISQTAILKYRHPKVSMPFVSESVKQQHYNYSQPIDEPIWSGIFKIGSKEYVSFAAHLSIKSCEKVWTLSRSLLPVVEVTKLSRSEVWPRIWEASRPTDDSIGLYFFPHKMRPDEHLDQLVKEVMENDMVLRAVIDEAEMLIFPSILLPKPYETFQRKHYLWGVFKRRNDMVAVVEEHHGTGHHAQEEEMDKHASHQQDEVLKRRNDMVTVVEEHHGTGHHAQEEEMDKHASHQQDEVQCEETDEETLMNRAMRLKKQRLVGKHRGVDQQDEVQCEESDQELLMNRAMLLKKQQLMGTRRGVEKEGVEASTPQVKASCVPWPNMDTELEAPEEANRHIDKELTPSLAGPNAPRLDERNTEASSAPTRPATTSDHGQTDSSLGVPPGKMFAFVVRQTPRLEQLVREMEREGALVVAMQGEMIRSGFGQATAVQ